jgi:uncharacterized SAM-binding protein YcdF (DUF218 family)
VGSAGRENVSPPEDDAGRVGAAAGRPPSGPARSARRWRRVVFVTSTWIVLLAIVVVAFVVLDPEAPARWLIVQDPLEPADAALVMTGDVDYERTVAAAHLLEDGYARILVLTGGEPWPGDSAQSLRDRAIQEGVSPSQIRVETTSASTRESLVAVRPILQAEGVRSVLLVTSPYHQRRASMAARKALPGVRIISRPAPSAHWAPNTWWESAYSRRIVMKEYLKLGYYILRGWA